MVLNRKTRRPNALIFIAPKHVGIRRENGLCLDTVSAEACLNDMKPAVIN
ncbi:hypothetical protein SAMN04490194_6381 [Pseudomonas migulae]|uniref:Uncharacterized protein n=2 Tax=Pseudomonas fluorescens group TaxID=136843 RepID=A0ABY0VIF8_9PSED|nr:hypothetical protein SAMN04489801_1992 [Pseudomonas mandelii]SEF03298.1 hypothetical protein SAMN04490194_6381 [Pseudomonas migulae]